MGEFECGFSVHFVLIVLCVLPFEFYRLDIATGISQMKSKYTHMIVHRNECVKLLLVMTPRVDEWVPLRVGQIFFSYQGVEN